MGILKPLASRDALPELLDEGNHPPDELFETFEDMRRVNWLLGGVAITLKGLERLTGHLRAGACLTVLDVGTGHADIPRAVIKWGNERRITCQLIGVDLDRSTLVTARMLPENQPVDLVQGDMLQLPMSENSVDITMTSMTLHHLDDDQAILALNEMARISRLGIIVNDLLRTVHGYAVAWTLGRVATGNRLTRHDAHRSIRRGRTVAELEELALQAGLQRPVFDSTLGYRTAMTIGLRQW